MVVSILAGVNADGTSDMTHGRASGSGSRSRSASRAAPSSCSCRTPLPAPPPGGYYVVEVTGGFVNNTIAGQHDRPDRQVLHGHQARRRRTTGSRIVGNHFIGGTTYDDGYNGHGDHAGGHHRLGGQRARRFPLPWGWTALPNLGAIVEDNTIQDSLGGILIGVEHGVNYWTSRSVSTSLGDRPRLRDGDGDRQHLRVRFQLPAGLGAASTSPTGTIPPRSRRPRP